MIKVIGMFHPEKYVKLICIDTEQSKIMQTEDNPTTASNVTVTWDPQGYESLVSKEDLKGDLAQENTTLNFEDYWVIQEDSTPILQALADARDVYIQNPESMDVAWASEFEVPADMLDYSKKKQI